MKINHLIHQVRKSAKANRDLIVAPGMRTGRKWPLCLTCGREVDAVELKNVNAHSVEIWARHHNKEDFFKVEFPYRIDGDPLEDQHANDQIQMAMNAAVFFDPYEVKK